MRRTLRISAALALLGLLLAGCATTPLVIPPEESPGPLPAAVAAFAGPAFPAGEDNPDSLFRMEAGEIRSAYGCTVEYEYYQPAPGAAGLPGPWEGQGSGTPLVVLAHGFMSTLSSMRGWAEQWAARGVRTVVVSFCNSSWLDGRQDRNADDMIAVASQVEPGNAPILYAGFSAGGLSALLAAKSDPRAIAYLGLDPVETGGLAEAVERLSVPALFVFGWPSSCNAQNNLIPVMPESPRRIALRVPYASHCDFENPYNPDCAGVCGAVEPEPLGDEVRSTIRGVATAWVVAQMGSDPASQTIFRRDTLEELARVRRVEILALE